MVRWNGVYYGTMLTPISEVVGEMREKKVGLLARSLSLYILK